MYAYGVVYIGTIEFSQHGVHNVSFVKLLFLPFSVAFDIRIFHFELDSFVFYLAVVVYCIVCLVHLSISLSSLVGVTNKMLDL